MALEQRSLEIPVGSRNILDGKLHADTDEDGEESGGKAKALTAQEKADLPGGGRLVGEFG